MIVITDRCNIYNILDVIYCPHHPDGIIDEFSFECNCRKPKPGMILGAKKKYNIEDMIKGDVIFCASGVTDGEMLKGIRDLGDNFEVSSFVLHKSQSISKKITNIQKK